MTTKLRTLPLASVADAARCTRLERAWDSSRRVEYFKADVALRQRNEEAAKEGRPLELFWRHLYRPDQVGWWVHSRGRGGGGGGGGAAAAAPGGALAGLYAQPAGPPARSPTAAPPLPPCRCRACSARRLLPWSWARGCPRATASPPRA